MEKTKEFEVNTDRTNIESVINYIKAQIKSQEEKAGKDYVPISRSKVCLGAFLSKEIAEKTEDLEHLLAQAEAMDVFSPVKEEEYALVSAIFDTKAVLDYLIEQRTAYEEKISNMSANREYIPFGVNLGSMSNHWKKELKKYEQIHAQLDSVANQAQPE